LKPKPYYFGDKTMNVREIISIAVSLVLTITPALAKDADLFQELKLTIGDRYGDMANWRITNHRPLGLYGVGNDVQFRSAYIDTSDEEKAQFAYDLGQYLDQHYLGYDSFVNNLHRSNSALHSLQSVVNLQGQVTKNLNDNAQDIIAASLDDSYNYGNLKAWADKWWYSENASYRQAGPFWNNKDWFLNDALLDGTNIYLRSQEIYSYGDNDKTNRHYYNSLFLRALSDNRSGLSS
jgi:hypothetical protein